MGLFLHLVAGMITTASALGQPQPVDTELHRYAAAGDLEGIKRTLDRDPGLVNLADDQGNTPLHYAVRFSTAAPAQLLLSREAEVDPVNRVGKTPFLLACGTYPAKFDLIKLLISKGANLKSVDNQGNTALHLMPRTNSEHLASLLLGVGVDPDVQNKAGLTILESERGLRKEIRSVLEQFIGQMRDPAPMVPLANADCRKRVFTLEPGTLSSLTSTKVGRISGPLTWSKTPKGRNYLGPFAQQKISLKLDRLNDHRFVTVEIDLFIIDSWDGSGDYQGPDVMDISIPGQGSLLHSSFYNNSERERAGLPLQSYPAAFPFGFNLGYTGAAESRSLGLGARFDRDAVYKLSFTFAHTGPDFKLDLAGLTVPQPTTVGLLEDERWGLGALSVRTD